MSRTLSTRNQSEVTKQTTKLVWLVEFGFGSPLRLSSRETIAVSGGNTFTAAGMRVDLSRGQIDLFNAGFAYSSTFLTRTGGETAKVWAVYGAAPFASADLDMMFDGQIGPVPAIGPVITIQLRESAPVFTPRIVVQPPTFNHVPPDGFEIVTPTGVYTVSQE